MEITKADSLFLSHSYEKSTVYSNEVKDWTNCELSTAEMSGVRNQAYIGNVIRRAYIKSGMKFMIAGSVLSNVLFRTSDLQAIVETIEAPATSYVTALLLYLKNQDGEK